MWWWLLLACSSEDRLIRMDGHDTFYQRETLSADILWVVDDSPSMADEQALLAQGFREFTLLMEAYETDFHIGVVSTSFDEEDEDRGVLIGEPAYLTPEDDYVRLFRERALVGTDGSDKEKGLAAAEFALSPALVDSANAGFRRDGAKLAVVFVSDENDCSDDGLLDGQSAEACYERVRQLVPVADYLQFFRNQVVREEDFISGAIVGPLASGGCEEAVPGHRYLEIAEQTGGRVGSICEPDFSDTLSVLGDEIAGLRSSFLLSENAVASSILVWVDDIEVSASPVAGWQYDADTRYLTFSAPMVPASGSQIDVYYDLASGP